MQELAARTGHSQIAHQEGALQAIGSTTRMCMGKEGAHTDFLAPFSLAVYLIQVDEPLAPMVVIDFDV